MDLLYWGFGLHQRFITYMLEFNQTT